MLNSRNINPSLQALVSYRKGAEVEWPEALLADLADITDAPKIPQPDPSALAAAYLAAKDPATDKTVQRQMFLMQAQNLDIQSHLEGEVAQRRKDVCSKHAQSLMDLFGEVVERDYPILKAAIDLGITNLEHAPNLSIMTENELIALVAARKANKRIKNAALGWHSAAHGFNGASIGSLPGLLASDIPLMDSINLRDSHADPFDIALAGYTLSLPLDRDELNKQALQRMEAYKASTAKLSREGYVLR